MKSPSPALRGVPLESQFRTKQEAIQEIKRLREVLRQIASQTDPRWSRAMADEEWHRMMLAERGTTEEAARAFADMKAYFSGGAGR